VRWFLVVVVAAFGVACGSSVAGPPAAGQTGNPAPGFSPAATAITALSGSGPQALTPIQGPVQEITIVAGERTREYYFEPNEIRVKPGKVRVRFINEGERAHTFNIKNRGNDWSDKFNFDTIFSGQETTVEFTILEEGPYLFYCALYGHLDFGQFGTLTVKQ